ncbi:response regulator [Spirosoma sp. BT702]|uniref:histidine kinase n=1 Tax=Spirosoma profusum TaxID=2771354 RepID=A0A926Y1Y6_9BACT|nr:two-component regulator propeller domain-containing protein [Spirosoma profusum]MBD2704641.1 response regulator [Spirosoma profusum]
MNSRIIVLLFWLWYPITALAQSGKLFTVENGLSGSVVSDIHQDRSGFLWIATEDGLNRFDGIKFTIYRHDKKNDTGILSNLLQTLFEDKAGRMYVGSLEGLQYYDPATDSFHKIPLKLDDGTIVSTRVVSIYERKNGDILVGTSGRGLFTLTKKEGQLLGKKMHLDVPSELIVKVFEDTDRNVWVSTEDKGLYRFDGRSVKSFFGSKRIQNNVVKSICQDRYGRLFVGNMSSGLYRYDPASQTFVAIPYNGRINLSIDELLVNRNNQILIGTSGEGVKYFDPATNKIMDLNTNGTSFDFSKSKVHSILEDKAGNIWIGTFQKGLLLLAGNPNRFGYIGYKSVSSNSIGSSTVMALFEDTQKTIWVGTDNDGLYSLSPGSNANGHYKPDTEGGPVPANIMTIYEDSRNTIWLGSYLSGLVQFDRKTGISRPINKLIGKNGDNVQRVFSIKEDSQQRLWVATMGSGLFYLDLRSGNVKNFDAPPSKLYRPASNLLPNNWINCLHISKDNKLFIGTFDGLACLDLDTESFVSTFGSSQLLKNVVIYSLFDDNKGNLWLGTSHGLKRLNRSTKEITSFDVDNGLPSSLISAIRGDNDGHLWLSTNRGLSRMDLETNTFVNFYSADGLQGNEFSQGASIEANNGELYFGGVNGITHFKPEEIRIANKRLAVQIVDFYIHDKPVKKGTESGGYQVVDTTVNSASEFHLSHQDNSFTLEFSTMDFIDAERVSYLYSINNNSWVTLRPGSNRLTFDNLAPGTYVFRLKAKANKAISDERQVTIFIHPAWYLSVWAKFVYGLLILILSGLIYRTIRNRRRINEERLAHQRLEEVNEAKLQFFINIAHEIRTPLTLVVSPLQKLISHDQDKERRHLYDIMGRNTKRILDLVNQLMDIRKIEKGQMALQLDRVDMVQFTGEICQLFEEQIHAKQIHFIMDFPTDQVFARIDPLNFDKVLINILSNAFKFTPNDGTIRVALTLKPNRNDQDLVIAIEDSGQCINEAETERIFDCFYQSADHRDYNQAGTGIGLHLVKQLVQLHGGTIKVENIDPIGCCFSITLPVEEIVAAEVPSMIPLETGIQRLPEPKVEELSGSARLKRKSKRLVIADDDSEICNYLIDELSGEYDVFSYANGEEAYKGILKEKPDLVVSDVMMPVMDGMALCRKMRANPLVNHIPIVLLTAKTEESSNVQGLELGADAYITKPFNMDILLKTVNGLIKNRQILKNNEHEHHYQEEFISKISIKAAEEKLLEKVHLIINQNLASPELSVEMIAGEIGISRVHLHRKLKELTNVTTRDLIRTIRMKQAADLLTIKGLSVSEVSFAVGYPNVNNFSVAFKELYGVSPTGYSAHYVVKERSEGLTIIT